MHRSLRTLVAVLCAAFPAAAFAAAFAGVSLSVSKENAPPGGMAQVKVFVTEPKPISTGGGHLTFDAYDSLLGIALAGESRDTVGVALVRGSSFDVSILSATAAFGTMLDYPILTIVGHIPSDTAVGVKFPLTIDPNALQLFDSTGAVYPVEVKQGHLITGAGVAIGDVNPGSAVLPAGSVVTITGSNFDPGTKIRFGEAKIAQTRYVTPTQIDVVLGSPADMHGMFIRAVNSDGSKSEYYSYQRTFAASRSADPVLQYAVPLLPPNLVTSATVAFPAPTASEVHGVALQNIGAGDALVTIELLDGGSVVGATQLLVPQNRYMVRSLAELFGFAPSGASSVLVTSPSQPIEVLGLTADEAIGTARPVNRQ